MRRRRAGHGDDPGAPQLTETRSAARHGALSSERLRRLHAVLAAHVDRGAVPGLVTLVSRRGDVKVDVIGYADADRRRRMARDSIFRIASMTKPVTATAVMILVEEGTVRLDDAATGQLPELADLRVLRRLDADVEDTVAAERPITVRDLLTFTMGTGLVFANPGTYPIQHAIDRAGVGPGSPGGGARITGDEWLKRLASLPLVAQPGEKWMYNTGSEALGILVARASGQSLEEFMRRRIFEPLGMRDTGFSVPAGEIGRLTESYLTDPESGSLSLHDPAEGGAWSRPPAFASGGAGLVSTVDDFARFAAMLLGRGTVDGVRILSRPSVETMTMDHLTADQKARTPWLPGYFETHGWGFGMSVVTRRYDIASTPGKYGWDGGLGTTWYNDPAEEMTTILLTPASMTSPAAPPVFRDFWTLAYAAIDD